MKNSLKLSILAAILAATYTLAPGIQAFAASFGQGILIQKMIEIKQHHRGELEDRLDLSSEQKQALDTIKADAWAQAEPLLDQSIAKHKELASYMASSKATPEGAAGLETELALIRSELTTVKRDAIFKAKAVLTPEQNQQLSVYLDEQISRFDGKRTYIKGLLKKLVSE